MASPTTAQDQRPNIVFILTDQQRLDTINGWAIPIWTRSISIVW